MKLAIALSSILLVCSVTTANPVNPSATTSAEPSSSTAAFTTTTDSYSNFLPASSVQAINSVDLSKLSDDDKSLMGKYLETSENHKKMKETQRPAESKIFDQKALIERLDEKHTKLLGKSHNNGGFVEELTKRLFGDDLDQSSIDSYIAFIKFNPRFIESIYSSLNRTPGQQPGTEQASTSGTQNQSQYRENPSSSTHEAPKSSRPQKKSRSHAKKAYTKIKSGLGSGPNQDNTDREPLI
ncbi:hypothetical protein BATDEDRAFT_92038 [Batrachochytrium dendrobatidis JAM81]|uniref:Uncharacterized protein n=1 Tax=Batrachochytrium dendrobatidis (strain JAM81 / FGSC 10211) TaxID=684364 RepID=F4PC46_BATDJ|nr:uncharacterized protein BATDEDRAFT_92038 [Batrachochytrium dendrobatidis JAM81]EGF77054.1 hypothetical protein BATDEDRAFT_92038 [Batrachochytrium dendrobatidis JAM81]|eukprot:XP_006682257.1 hypothetical protein BATDEDRAFT_92038 [Batrachochytrium dendrobatidis JAM81]